MVVTFLTGVVLARVLGVADRGYYGVAQFIAQFGVTFFLFSANEAFTIVLRRGHIENERSVPIVIVGSTILFSVFLAVLMLVVFFGLIQLETGLTSGQFSSTVAILAAIGFLTHFFISVESANLAFFRLNVDRVISPALFLLLVVMLWYAGMATIFNLLLAFAISKLPVLTLRFWRFREYLFMKIDVPLAKETCRLAPRLHLAMGAMTLSNNADRIVAVSLWPAEWLGYFFIAFSAAGAGISLAAQAIQITLLPHMAGLPVDEKRYLFERAFRLALVAGFAVAIPVWIFAPWIVPLIYGADFAPAAAFVRGLVLAMAFTPAIWTVNVANRSAGRGGPGVEMAVASLTVFAIGYGLTGFSTPHSLFATMIIANIATIIAGLRHLRIEGSLGHYIMLIPSGQDVAFLVQLMKQKLSRSPRANK